MKMEELKPEPTQDQPLLWYVAHTRPRCEKKLAAYCALEALAATLPCYKNVRKYQRKTVIFEKPLFPGYLFLRLMNSQKAHVIGSQYVANLLNVPYQEEFETQLNDILRALDTKLEIQLAPEIQKGMRVKIKNGPLRGMEGWVDARCGVFQVLLCLDFISQAAAVRVDAGDLEPV